MAEESEHSASGLQWVVYLVFVAIFVSLIFKVQDWIGVKAGWISHEHDTSVWIQEDWLVGEYRVCKMATVTPRLFCGSGDSFDSVADFAFSVPNADVNDAFKAAHAALAGNKNTDWSMFEKYFHVMPVRYYGRYDRTDRVEISWRCQRNSDSLTCKALD